MTRFTSHSTLKAADLGSSEDPGSPYWRLDLGAHINKIPKKTLVERLTPYKEKYTKNGEQLERILAAAVDTPKSNDLVGTFVGRVLLEK